MKSTTKRILIADDDRAMTTALAAHLYQHGFEPIVTFDAMHATMVLGHAELSAAILDINMPGGTGLEVLRRLKSNLRLVKVPVIVLTGTEDPATHARALRLGAAVILKKPSSNAGVMQVLFDVLKAAESKRTSAPITVPMHRSDFNIKYNRRFQ